MAENHPGTGLPGLDRILEGLRAGDNVVWQVGTVDDYRPFALPFRDEALRRGDRLIYIHFERHDELIAPDPRVEIHRLDPASGFETLTAEIHRIIAAAGAGACYIFDCLSDLAADWYSDMMLANFFKVTCPYLAELDTIAYFALLRRRHSYRTVAAIRDTTQLLLDVHRHENTLYLHPLKVYQRYSPTMYLPHVRQGDAFRPVTESNVVSGIYEPLMREGPGSGADRFDLWDRTFHAAQETVEAVRRGERQPASERETFRRLLRMVISRNDRMLELAERYLSIEELLAVRRRMIGAGLIGGKAAGMLVARAILKKSNARWAQILEPHDSFFVGSDVFYSYLVDNGCWRMRRQQRDPAGFLENLEHAHERMLAGAFPEFVRDQFLEMLDYFGQAPIVVRSSSLLEDSFGNAFSGKYESVFCVNQGSPQERLQGFLAAVRRVYASAMGRDALLYRAERGLLDRDEQMALLVQRVSGATHGSLFFPQVAGVGLSFNPFVWSEHIDPEAGVLRMVFGLGTRAVRRTDNDYTRIVALNAPMRRPETASDEMREFAQWRVDVLDLEGKEHAVRSFEEVVKACGEPCIQMVANRDPEQVRRSRETGRAMFPWVLDFKRLLTQTAFPADMRDILATLQKAYDYPVDVEFTANFVPGGEYRINVVQCRPFQVKGGGPVAPLPDSVPDFDLVFRTRGPVIGPALSTPVGRLIYVVPGEYARLAQTERYSVARLVGRLTRLPEQPRGALVLAGPGRWGTTEPSLGVPVSFAEISRVTALCEVIEMRDGLMPDVSLGTHFFNDLVEMQVLYLALVSGNAGNVVNEEFVEQAPNLLARLIPAEAGWSPVIRVIDPCVLAGRPELTLQADPLRQAAICYFRRSRMTGQGVEPESPAAE